MSTVITIPKLGPGADRYGHLHIMVNVSTVITIPELGPAVAEVRATRATRAARPARPGATASGPLP